MNEAELFEELRHASEAFKIAESATNHARGLETSALNRLNNAQRAVSDMMIELKKSAPRQSDWRLAETRGLPG